MFRLYGVGAEEIWEWFEIAFIWRQLIEFFFKIQVVYYIPDDKVGQHCQHLQSLIQYWFALEIRHSSNQNNSEVEGG